MRIIAGEWRGRKLRAPRGRGVRPTTDRVREAWMSIVAPLLPEAEVLDLFAGTGALGIEALSRGARRAVFVERDRAAARLLRANLRDLEAEDRAEVVEDDVFRYLSRRSGPPVTLAFADPPYGSGLAPRLVETFGTLPFAGWLTVEHGRHEAVLAPPAAEHRRYGDTVITLIPAET